MMPNEVDYSKLPVWYPDYICSTDDTKLVEAKNSLCCGIF